MSKEKEIELIKGRILDEYRKHTDLDWAEIAARKIYDQFNFYYETEIKSLQSERDRLQQWKDEMLSLWSPIDDHVRPLTALGESVSGKALSLLKERDRLRETLEKIVESPTATSAYHYAKNALTRKEVKDGE